MKAFLMYPVQDFDLGRELPPATADLIQDLELGTLFDAMALFLRAQRQPDGTRSFGMAPGEPLPTSHGPDVYRRIFAAALDHVS